MPRLTVFLLSAILVLAGIETSDARRSGGGFSSSRSSSSSSRSWSSSKTTSRTKSGSEIKTAPKKKQEKAVVSKKATQGRTKSGSKIKTTSKDAKPKGKITKKSTVDQKMAKKLAADKRTYKSKAEAETAYKQKMGENKYKTKPATRPNHIPETYSTGGQTYNTVFVGGQYGYHVGGVFRPYTYTDYVVDRAMMVAAGMWMYDDITYHNGVASYHAPVVHTTPVRSAPTNRNDVMIVLIVIGAIVAVVVIGFIIANRNNG